MTNAAHEFWARAVATEFAATRPDGSATLLRLDACSPLVSSGRSSSFSLAFTAEAAGPAPEQGTYLLRKADGATEHVFLVPIARHDDRIEFEAVFNQLSEVAR